MPIAWVASYPKSGNTWVRILLAGYLQDGPVSGMDNLQKATPDFGATFRSGRMLPLDGSDPVIVKTHFLPSVEVIRPYREASTKVIYVVRNPRDVIHSADRFLDIADEHHADFARHFIAHRGVQDWEQVGWGSWPGHVAEWTFPELLGRHLPHAEICVVRYEDLRRDPAAELQRMLTFLEIDAGDPERVERAVTNSALDKMREVERKDSSPGTQAFVRNSRTSFFGPGLTGQSLADVFGDDVEAGYRRLLAEGEFAAVAARYGYLDAPVPPSVSAPAPAPAPAPASRKEPSVR